MEELRDAEESEDKASKSRKWRLEIELAEKDTEKWRKKGREIVRIYRNKSEDDSGFSFRRSGSTFNILWSNVQTLMPSLYAATPKVQVERRFRDADPIGRTAAEVLERSVDNITQTEDIDPVITLVVSDYLLSGRGCAWVRYVPHLDERGHVAYEEAKIEYVYWEDFLMSPARTWQEVRWVARRSYMTRDELKARFGDDVGSKVPLDYSKSEAAKLLSEDEQKREDLYKKAVVYELWDKATRSVYWFSSNHEDLLDSQKDPLNLEEFFPCPRPLQATTTSDSFVPTPDYALYEDQARELDELTSRIDVLTEALVVRGVYDASKDEIARLLDSNAENQLIPVADWTTFSSQGGLQSCVNFMPLGEVVQALNQLIQLREVVKRDIYEKTGLSDIIRGQGHARESAAAQQIKGQFASLRLKDRQKEVQRFARDLIAIVGEVVSEHFSDQSIAMIAGVDLLNPQFQQTFPQALALLRNDVLRNFRIDIETDSTIAINHEEEKKARNEFLGFVGQFMGNTLPMTKQLPSLTPVIGEMLLFGARAYKTGRQLEGALEQFIGQMTQAAMQSAQQPPQPSEEEKRVQMEYQLRQAKLQQETQLGQAKLQQSAQADQLKLQSEAQIAQFKAQHEIRMKEAELALKRAEAEQSLELQAKRAEIELGIKLRKQELDGKERLIKAQGKAEEQAAKAAEKVIDKASNLVGAPVAAVGISTEA